MTAEKTTLDDSGFQTKTHLQRLLTAAGAAPRRRYGQCFLIDRNLMVKLVESADIRPDDWVLEVGCGGGSLTSIVASVAGRVIAVDIDPAMITVATEHLSSRQNVTLIHADALRKKSALADEVTAAIQAARRAVTGRGLLVANLPYDIATSLVVNLLVGDFGIDRYCFTVQAEVADRFLAHPETADYGPVSVVAQTLAIGSRIARVPPQAFWPSPKVHSAMVRLDRRGDDEQIIRNPSEYAAFLREVFQSRRKTLGHIFSRLPAGEALIRSLADIGLSSQARPAEVAVEAWQTLFLVRQEARRTSTRKD